MTAAFEQYLSQFPSLSTDDISSICAAAVFRSLKRNENILVPGEICRYKIFVQSGLLFTYSVSEEGSETVLQLSPEDNWTLDAESYDLELPSRYYIAALEPSELLLWPKTEFLRLLAEIPGLRKLSEQLISRNVYSGRERLLTALSASPEEKYKEFTDKFPGLLTRVPLRIIAAYLGISLKTLTRVRHAQWARTAKQ